MICPRPLARLSMAGMDLGQIALAVVGLLTSMGVLLGGAGFLVKSMGSSYGSIISALQSQVAGLTNQNAALMAQTTAQTNQNTAVIQQNTSQQDQINKWQGKVTELEKSHADCVKARDDDHKEIVALKERVAKVETDNPPKS